MIDFDALLEGMLGRAPPAGLAADMAAILPRYDITTDLRIAHFLAQIAEETGGFRAYVENLNYSAPGLMRTWPSRFPTLAIAEQYAHRPEAIANKVYANRMGNGDEASGDGWRYRGRGDLETTGRDNYAEAARETGLDLLGNPDLLTGFAGASLTAAAAFWALHGCNALADDDNLVAVTRCVNGGLLGFANRKAWLAKIKAVLLAQQAAPQPASDPAPTAAEPPPPAPIPDDPGASGDDAAPDDQPFEIPPLARSLWSAYGHRGLAWISGGLTGVGAMVASLVRDHGLAVLLIGLSVFLAILVLLLAWIKEHDRNADLVRARNAPAPDAPLPAAPGLSEADITRIVARLAELKAVA